MTLLEEGARTHEIAHIEVDLSATPQTKQLHRTIGARFANLRDLSGEG